MRGGGGEDDLFADASPKMNGGSGDDYFASSVKNDTIVGGPGRDLVPIPLRLARASGWTSRRKARRATEPDTRRPSRTSRVRPPPTSSPAMRIRSPCTGTVEVTLSSAAGRRRPLERGSTIGDESIDGGKGADYCVGGDSVGRCEFRFAGETAELVGPTVAVADATRVRGQALRGSAELMRKVEGMAWPRRSPAARWRPKYAPGAVELFSLSATPRTPARPSDRRAAESQLQGA